VPAAPTLLARYFANDLAQLGERLVLALDDVHLLKEPAIFDLLAELLRHPQACLHLVLIGRRDPPLPIATLRGRGEVAEIRARDLQFTAPETRRLLGHILGRDVDDATATEWTARTEGWVTALRLVALSLMQRYDGAAPALAALDRPRYVQEYLLADVLARLPAERRTWLLRTALLERFCAPLCEAICLDGQGCAELTGVAFIRWLQEDNLFLVSTTCFATCCANCLWSSAARPRSRPFSAARRPGSPKTGCSTRPSSTRRRPATTLWPRNWWSRGVTR
jgi:LuxR family maltose regulon positive regulatory protein